MSEWVRDDHLLKIFETTDSTVRVTACPINGTAMAEVSLGKVDRDGELVTADDCMELCAFFGCLSQYLRSIKLEQDLKEITFEKQDA